MMLLATGAWGADTVKIDYGYGITDRSGYALDTFIVLGYNGYVVDTLIERVDTATTTIDTHVVISGTGYYRVVLWGVYDGYPDEWYEVKKWELTLSTAAALSGGGSHATTIYATDTSGTDAYVSGVPVTITDLSGTTKGHLTTNTSGYAVFNLDSGSHVISAPIAGGYVWLRDTILVPGAAVGDTLWGYDIAVGSPGSANLCRLYGYIYDIQGNPVQDATVTASLSSSGMVDSCTGVALDGYARSATTNSSGYWYLDLVKSLCIQSSVLSSSAAKKYHITGNYPSGTEAFSKRYTVPDSTSHKMVW